MSILIFIYVCVCVCGFIAHSMKTLNHREWLQYALSWPRAGSFSSAKFICWGPWWNISLQHMCQLFAARSLHGMVLSNGVEDAWLALRNYKQRAMNFDHARFLYYFVDCSVSKCQLVMTCEKKSTIPQFTPPEIWKYHAGLLGIQRANMNRADYSQRVGVVTSDGNVIPLFTFLQDLSLNTSIGFERSGLGQEFNCWNIYVCKRTIPHKQEKPFMALRQFLRPNNPLHLAT